MKNNMENLTKNIWWIMDFFSLDKKSDDPYINELKDMFKECFSYCDIVRKDNTIQIVSTKEKTWLDSIMFQMFLENVWWNTYIDIDELDVKQNIKDIIDSIMNNLWSIDLFFEELKRYKE